MRVGLFSGYTLPCRTPGRDAGKTLRKFIELHDATRGVIVKGEVKVGDLLGPSRPMPELTSFAAVHDTHLFGGVVSAMLRLGGSEIKQIVDLGAGSSVPTIRALLDNPNSTASVMAIDMSPEAVSVSARNATLFGLADRYEFDQADMLESLCTRARVNGGAFAANPPYLPVPTSIASDPYFFPVDGGEDGARYLSAVLQQDYASGTYLALEWCSLSNPIRIIDLIESGYDVLYVQAHDIMSALYTEHPLLKPHLLDQHERGESALLLGDSGEIGWTFMGTVLRKK